MKVRFVFLLIFALSFTVSSIATNAFAQFVADDLASYWSFDKNTISGKTVKDIKGGNDGTINGDPEVVAGKLNEALKFNGEDDYVAIPASAINDLAEGTIEAWVKLDSEEGGGAITGKEHGGVVTSAVFSIGSFANMNGMLAQGEAGILYFHSKNPGGPENAVSSSTIEAEEWHHVAVTFDTSNATFYIDGSWDSTADGDYSVPDDPEPNSTNIGAWLETDAASYFSGAIDEVRVYSRVLSEKEIKQNFDAAAAVLPDEKLAFTWGKIKASR